MCQFFFSEMTHAQGTTDKNLVQETEVPRDRWHGFFHEGYGWIPLDLLVTSQHPGYGVDLTNRD